MARRFPSRHAARLLRGGGLLALCALPAAAQESPAAGGTSSGVVVNLDTVTVLADRRPASAITSLGGVSVVTRPEIRRFEPDTIGEVLATIPGVAVASRDDDPGVSPNIRGLQDYGRVAVLVDGARQNFQVTGHNANGAFYVDPALLAGVDVVRGPVANAYGSGAIGGVISMRTLGLDDLLDPSEAYGARLGASAGLNGPNGLGTLEAGAYLSDDVDVFAAGVLRRVEDYDDGDGNAVRNTGFDVGSGVAKARLRPFEGHEVELSGLLYDTDFTSSTGGGADRDTDVTNRTYRLSYAVDDPNTDLLNLNAAAYRTETDYRQRFLDEGGGNRSVDVETTGFDVSNSAEANLTDSLLATLTLGGDLFRDDVESRDSVGTTELFTPSGRRTVGGGFAQAQFDYDAWLQLTVGGRYDRFDLDSGANENEGDRFSPKIGVGVTPVQGLQIYGLYAEGLRAPALSEAIVSGFHPAPAAFEFLPNPDLSPEVGRTIEAGVNLSYDDLLMPGDAFRAKVSVYRNDVEDFINTVTTDRTDVLNPCVASVRGRCVARLPFDAITYANIEEARLQGLEVEAAYDAGWGFVGLGGTLNEGENKDTGAPLNSVYPDRLTATAGLRALSDTLTYGARLHLVDSKDADEVSDPALATSGYGLVDLFLAYEPTENLRYHAEVKNLFDKRYVEYSGGGSSEAFPAPGFEAKVGMSIKFAAPKALK